jgi:hypothetical protein
MDKTLQEQFDSNVKKINKKISKLEFEALERKKAKMPKRMKLSIRKRIKELEGQYEGSLIDLNQR